MTGNIHREWVGDSGWLGARDDAIRRPLDEGDSVAPREPDCRRPRPNTSAGADRERGTEGRSPDARTRVKAPPADQSEASRRPWPEHATARPACARQGVVLAVGPRKSRSISLPAPMSRERHSQSEALSSVAVYLRAGLPAVRQSRRGWLAPLQDQP